MRSFPWTCVAVVALAASAHSQNIARPFPADLIRVEAAPAEVVLLPRLGELASLADAGPLTLTDLLLPDGGRVALDLRPLDPARHEFAFLVDGEPRPDLLDGLDLSIWVGTVAGDPASEAFVSFSLAGSRGWIRADGQLWHLLAAPADGQGTDEPVDWSASVIRIVSDATLVADGRSLDDFCAADRLAEMQTGPQRAPQAPGMPAPGANAEGAGGDLCQLKECPIALECDWQLYQIWNDLAAETAYLTSLLTWIGARFETQANTVLTFPHFQIWTTAADPWTQQDTGGGCVDVLFELQAAWAFNIPGNAAVGHLLSGANLGCGVAFLATLCNEEYGFSVSGNLDGGTQFPVAQQSGNWDFMVIAHELGHNFSAPHTHDLGIDNCAGGACISNGTIMSYCHICSGGTANITTFFQEPIVTGLLQAGAECLPDYGTPVTTYCTALINSLGCEPTIGYSGAPTLTGNDDFFITGDEFVGAKAGLFFYGAGGPAAIPFLDGTLCFIPPIARTPLQYGGGSSGSCSGSYEFHFTQAAMTAAGLGPGDVVRGQYWTRDPDANAGAGLSNALEIAFCN